MDAKAKADVVRYGRAIPRSHLSLAISLRESDMRHYLTCDVGCIPVWAGYEAGLVLGIDESCVEDPDPVVYVYTIVDDVRAGYHFRASKLKWPAKSGMRDHAFDALATHCIRHVVGMPLPIHWPRIKKGDLKHAV